MGKNKLKKFSEIEQMDFVHQYPFGLLSREGFPHRGRWHELFGNDNPIVLELGCGKGEYTVGLARKNPDINYIGIDIKGARIWTGAKAAQMEKLGNVAFIRTNIELLEHFFAPGEVSGIWITFPDPQMKKQRKRLTSTRFLKLYRKICGAGADVKLKTDSPFLYAYTKEMARLNNLEIKAFSEDLHNDTATETLPESLMSIRTHYEQQWLDRGMSIKYLNFVLGEGALDSEPDDEEFDKDTYRSYSRGWIQMPELMNNSPYAWNIGHKIINRKS